MTLARVAVLAVLAALAAVPAAGRAEEPVWLDALDLGFAEQQYGIPRPRRNVLGDPLAIAGVRFEHGVGTHAVSALSFALDSAGVTFSALAGIDDSVPRGRGSVQFVVLGDGREMWKSGVVRSGDPAVPVEVSLHGVAVLDLVVRDADDYVFQDQADWAMARVKMGRGAPRPVRFTQRIRVDLSARHQTLQGFGAWDCWTAQQVGLWKTSRREEVADLLFSVDQGIGLSAWRFNIGAGRNDATLHDPARTSESFFDGRGYDWTRQAGERWFLRAAKARGVEHFVAGVLSPPPSMTRNALTTSIDGPDPTNLRPDREREFCKYVGEVIEHFARDAEPEERVAFERVVPFNCPEYDWIDRGMEGNRADNATLQRILLALDHELERRHLSCHVLGPEAGVVTALLDPVEDVSRRFGAPYGGYAGLLCPDDAIAGALDHTLSFHSTWIEDFAALVPQRRRARASLDRFPKWRLWQTEFHLERDPFGQPTNGVDLGMDTALSSARVIHYDLTLLGVCFWSWFQGISTANKNYGLLDTGWQMPGDGETIVVPKLLWAYGNYTRFLRPGAERVDVSNADYGVGDLLVSAWRRAAVDEVVVVLVNEAATARSILLSFEGDDGARRLFMPWVTSAASGDDLRACTPFPGGEAYVVPPRSVVTLVGRRVRGK